MKSVLSFFEVNQVLKTAVNKNYYNEFSIWTCVFFPTNDIISTAVTLFWIQKMVSSTSRLFSRCSSETFNNCNCSRFESSSDKSLLIFFSSMTRNFHTNNVSGVTQLFRTKPSFPPQHRYLFEEEQGFYALFAWIARIYGYIIFDTKHSAVSPDKFVLNVNTISSTRRVPRYLNHM